MKAPAIEHLTPAHLEAIQVTDQHKAAAQFLCEDVRLALELDRVGQ